MEVAKRSAVMGAARVGKEPVVDADSTAANILEVVVPTIAFALLATGAVISGQGPLVDGTRRCRGLRRRCNVGHVRQS